MISDIKELSAWIFFMIGLIAVLGWTTWRFSKQKSDASDDTSL